MYFIRQQNNIFTDDTTTGHFALCNINKKKKKGFVRQRILPTQGKQHFYVSPGKGCGFMVSTSRV